MTRRRKLAFALVAGALAVLAAGFYPSGVRARGAVDRRLALDDFRRLGDALRQFERRNGVLPASAAFAGADGRPLLGWRVALLPDIGEGALFAKFRLNEPFDSDHNSAVTRDNTVPELYQTPYAPAPPGSTRVAGFAADRKVKGDLLPAFNLGRHGLKLADFRDGPANTIHLVLAETPVPWAAPADLPFVAGADHKALIHFPRAWGGTTVAAMGDGSARLVPADTPATTLQALLTRNGGE